MAQRPKRVGTTIAERLHQRFRILMSLRGDRQTNLQDIVDLTVERWLDREEKRCGKRIPA
jgi:hypothetical protein